MDYQYPVFDTRTFTRHKFLSVWLYAKNSIYVKLEVFDRKKSW